MEHAGRYLALACTSSRANSIRPCCWPNQVRKGSVQTAMLIHIHPPAMANHSESSLREGWIAIAAVVQAVQRLKRAPAAYGRGSSGCEALGRWIG